MFPAVVVRNDSRDQRRQGRSQGIKDGQQSCLLDGDVKRIDQQGEKRGNGLVVGQPQKEQKKQNADDQKVHPSSSQSGNRRLGGLQKCRSVLQFGALMPPGLGGLFLPALFEVMEVQVGRSFVSHINNTGSADSNRHNNGVRNLFLGGSKFQGLLDVTPGTTLAVRH